MNDNFETKKVTKVFFAWEDEKEEKWLAEMAADGWKLTSVAPYIYHFQRGDPENVIYRLDYKLTTDQDYQEYLNIFKDSGWQMFATFSNWHYFRITPENNEIPEIYNSGKVKAQKYRRVLYGLIPLAPVYLLLFNPAIHYYESTRSSFGKGLLLGIEIMMGALFLLILYICLESSPRSDSLNLIQKNNI